MSKRTFEDHLFNAYGRYFLGALRLRSQARYWRDKKAFYCNALSGDSNFDIGVNCDLTVSCNCGDFKGRGRIGDLRTQSFSEIFAGPQAQALRRKLAQGLYAIPECFWCRELRVVDKDQAHEWLERYSLPRTGIQIENTVACNLHCIGCRQNQERLRSRKSMSAEDMQLVSSAVKELGLKEVHFFSLGEPFLAPQVCSHLSILRRDNPDIAISCSSNCLLIDSPEKREAAMAITKLWLSIHGSTEESVIRYQRGGSFNRAYTNMKALVDHRNSTGK